MSIGIAIYQAAGMGLESHIATVITYTGNVASIIPLCAVGMDTDPFSSACLPIVDEDVPFSIDVTIYQVVGIGLEGHIAAVCTHTSTIAVFISLCTIGMNADQFSSACLPIVDKDVPLSIGITICQVVGIGIKSHIAAVCTYIGMIIAGIPALIVSFSSIGMNTITCNWYLWEWPLA